MKKSCISIIIATLLGSASISFHTQAQTNNIQNIGTQTFQKIEELHALAIQGENTFTKNGKNYLHYNGYDYWLNFDNYIKFPFIINENDDAYRNIFSFLDEDWKFIWFDGGFQLLNLKYNDNLVNNDTGCFIQYIPASYGSILPNGEYAYESPMLQKINSAGCKDINQPIIDDLTISSLSDQGLSLSWSDQQDHENVSITLRNMTNKKDERVLTNLNSGSYIGSLIPNTTYQIEATNCNSTSCSLPVKLIVTTLPARLGFNDHEPSINHLSGELEAQLSFAQTGTTTAPFGNEDSGNPDLVINRSATLLLNPQDINIHKLQAEIFLNGVSQAKLTMLPPSSLADTDQPDNGRPKVVYSHRTWSIPLQWDWMQPGLSIRFTDNNGNIGDLTEDSIIFAGAPELVIQNIDIGMLMEPKGRNTMIKEMPTLSADYFQKIPVSKLIISDYTPAYFPKITMPNGKVYTEHSDDNGGWHSGDMREAIGKALVSTGINNANFGITDTAGFSQSYDHRLNHITAHTNNGKYANGEINHGGSGGGGIVTLTNTTGNEWSHELGHNYGLGHYPALASSHDFESGWGWDAFYNRFIGNINWTSAAYTNDVGGEIVPPFANEFGYLKDAQAGGYAQGIVSRYTLHHPKMNRRAASWFNSAAILDPNSKTGYSFWDQSQQRYIDADINYAAPLQQGVPVITILGVYDPIGENPSQIYPLLYSNYGNVFSLPAPSTVDYQLEGWQQVSKLTNEQLLATTWQTMKVNGNWLPICQFSYISSNNKEANFIGYLDQEKNICKVTDEQYWLIDDERYNPKSEQNDYLLLSSKGDTNERVTYIPTSELGEQALCTLNKEGTDHDGAGFEQNGKCRQIPGLKHTNGRDWVYTNPQEIKQHSLQSQRQCQIMLTNNQDNERIISLAGYRHTANQSNKFHINIPMDNYPSKIELSCNDVNGRTILDTQYPEYNPAAKLLTGPIIIGQDYGYDALKSTMPEGWFTHPVNGFNPKKLNSRDRTLLAHMPVHGKEMPVCRFDMHINNTVQTVHGYVETLNDNQYRCTGGNEITFLHNDTETTIQSDINQFEWLSLSDRDNVGKKAKAYKDSDKELCVVTRKGFYGAGFINEIGQCTQIPGIKWSNGNHWTFSNGYGGYTLR